MKKLSKKLDEPCPVCGHNPTMETGYLTSKLIFCACTKCKHEWEKPNLKGSY